MEIAVLSWGSLIWNPKALRINRCWKIDGPLLPIEFARISKKWPLTLVIYPYASEVQEQFEKIRDEYQTKLREKTNKSSQD